MLSLACIVDAESTEILPAPDLMFKVVLSVLTVLANVIGVISESCDVTVHVVAIVLQLTGFMCVHAVND